MLLRDFYRVIESEESACAFLQTNGLLEQRDSVINCHRCGTQMRTARKRGNGGEFRPIFRCPKKKCQTSRSMRKGNSFFSYTNLNGKLNCNLKLWEILELIYMFIYEIPLKTTCKVTGKSVSTVNDWFSMCREVCTNTMNVMRLGQMTGTQNDPIRIDEIPVAGKRKHKRGRLVDGVQKSESTDAETDDPWVFRVRKESDVRYFYVPNRNALLPIIQQHCILGSHIISDVWPSDSTHLKGFIHSTANNQQNDDVDPLNIEQSQLDSKLKIMAVIRGSTADMIQLRLDEYCWRSKNKNAPDLFIKFLNEIATIYNTRIG